jgi:hypothetical protein
VPTRTPDNSDDDTPKTMFEWQRRSINNPELGESWPMLSSPADGGIGKRLRPVGERYLEPLEQLPVFPCGPDKR